MFREAEDSKFIVLAGAGHAADYITAHGKKIRGIGNLLACPSASVYICEDGFDEILLNDAYEKRLPKNKLISMVTFRLFEERKKIKYTQESMKIDFLFSVRVIPRDLTLAKACQYVTISEYKALRSNITHSNISDFRWLPLLRDEKKRGGVEFDIGIQHYNQKQYKEAFSYFSQSAQEKFSDGLYMIGMMYRAGEGCKLNFNAALDYLKEAAQQDHADANYNLGHIYKYRNKKLAKRYLEKASVLGHPQAKMDLDALRVAEKSSTDENITQRNWSLSL